MKRFHVNVSVGDLERSIEFYRTLFGEEPVLVKDDYAKWMLDDPRVNFAISLSEGARGVNHVGLQADTTEELGDIQARLREARATGSCRQREPEAHAVVYRFGADRSAMGLDELLDDGDADAGAAAVAISTSQCQSWIIDGLCQERVN